MKRHTLLLAATALATPAQATIFTYDSSQVAYVIPAGTYTTYADLYADNVTSINNGTFNVTPTSSTTIAVLVSSSFPSAGNGSGSVNFTSNAPVTLNVVSASSAGPAILLQSQAGAGADGKPPQNGGSAGAINATFNNTGVTYSATVSPTSKVFGVLMQTSGASGGASQKKNDYDGAAGGNSGTLTLSATGSTFSANAPSTGAGSAAVGLTQTGGNGGSGDGHSIGGAGGATNAATATLTNSRITATGTNFGGLAISQTGGTGGQSSQDDSDGTGGVGGAASGVSLTLSGSTVTTSGADAVRVTQTGGTGGQASTSSTGGVGGNASLITGAVMDSTISATGTGARALAILQTGGAGGPGNLTDNKDHSAGATGGDSLGIGLALNAQTTAGSTIGTSGSTAPAVLASSTGGAGGNGTATGGGLQIAVGGGNGGNGGNAGGPSGSTTISSAGGLIVTTTGTSSPGIAALGQGGAGGSGGNVADLIAGTPGSGGSGGRGSPVTINLGSGLNVTTSGTTAPAVAAQSLGGQGGISGKQNSNFYGSGADGGAGGNSGQITVTLTSGTTLTTRGDQSPGLFVQGVAGAGGAAGYVDGGFFYGSGSPGGAGGNAGGASVTSAATIGTSGASSRGILVQVASGPGGAGAGASGGIIGSSGGNGGAAGTIGAVTVSNSGAITTTGSGAQGVLVQSIAGGGGTGGNSSGLIYASSGNGSGNFAGSNGGAITLTNTGTIRTTGAGAAAILVETIGGGGGDGGPSSGVFYARGGDATAGGTGGAVTVNLGGALFTSGSLSQGLNAQSVGGGGGNGGNVQTASAGATVAIGGSAGAGGAGGTVTVSPSGSLSIITTGTGAVGLVAQSVGGGGGTGGGAYGISVGEAFSFAAAVGGAGGSGGAGGAVTVSTNNATISTGRAVGATSAVDAIGLVAQSIGGGGGIGGGASAVAVANSLPPVTEDPEVKSVSITATYAAGGTGGSGGNGGAVNVNLGYSPGGGTSITTAGAGSIGALVQSVGGGGGQGGDASAFAATIGSASKYSALSAGTQSYSLDVAVGAAGGSGGSGGAVHLVTGLSSGNAADRVAITTTGDYANAISVQSIGGGGGNAGLGSAKVTSSGKVSTERVTVAVGASGGTGGLGGDVRIDSYSSTVVRTSGSGAIGILAQSIGGGGGTSTGTSVNLGGLLEQELTSNASLSFTGTISVGATGGSGNNGGGVSAYLQGQTTTVANDSPGVLLQSIGGGGGVGGAAGSDASDNGDSSGSNTGNTAQTARVVKLDATTGNPVNPNLTLETNYSLNIGGKGGAAGNGGTVTLSQFGTVTTSGDFSPGVVAQSVGGGGGRGGVAVQGGESNSLKSIVATGYVNAAVALGASGGGGAGGQGGAVTVSLGGGSVSTGVTGTGSKGTGFQSFGVLAQSVGGGGGTGGDGTVVPSGTYFLGAGLAGGGGASGSGGAVTLNAVSGTTGAYQVRTAGDAAHGVVLQSVGAGGGIAGAGSTLGAAIPFYPVTTSIKLGGASGSSGNGGSVTADNPLLNVSTTGAGAFGLLGQSLGGGGGIATVAGSPMTVSALGANGASGTGGAVSLTLGTGAVITTTGVGSHGIVAQSVGGGGGIATAYAAGATPGLSTDMSSLPASAGSGNGGAVTVISQGLISASGAGAVGVLAQSVGGGGGLGTSNGTLYSGSTNRIASSGSVGGAVTVTLQGTVQSTGTNGIGLFAQSASAGGAAAGTVTVNLGYFGPVSVVGGAGTGVGIIIAGGNSANALTVGGGSQVSAASGQAISYSGAYGIAVLNDGTITGSTSLGSGQLTNNGSLVSPGAGQAVVAGNLVQTGSGKLVTTADFAARQVGSFAVLGNATLGGTLQARLVSVLPNVRLPVLTVTGSVSGRLVATSSNLFDFALQPTAVGAGQRFDLIASGARFADARFGLTPGQGAVASHLQSVFDAGASPAFGTFFAALDASASQPAEYARRLGQLSPRSALSVGARRAADAAGIANASMSCPVFSGTTSFLQEGACTYFKAAGRTTSTGGDADRGNLKMDSATWQIGGQIEVSPGLFLGGSLAYETSWMSGDDGVKGRGSAGQGAVTLKYQTGPWLLTGAVFGTAGGIDLQRVVNVPGIAGVAKGSPTAQSAGIRARVAYTIGQDSLYVRPYLNIDGIYARTGAYTEYGAGSFGLAYGAADQTTAVITPAIEVGARTKLGDSATLRSFVSVGVDYRTNDQWRSSASFVGAPAGTSPFTTTASQDRTAARVGAGVQLFAGERIDLRAQYDGSFSGRTTAHGGALTFAYRM